MRSSRNHYAYEFKTLFNSIDLVMLFPPFFLLLSQHGIKVNKKILFIRQRDSGNQIHPLLHHNLKSMGHGAALSLKARAET